jgi:hypothetical protein
MKPISLWLPFVALGLAGGLVLAASRDWMRAEYGLAYVPLDAIFAVMTPLTLWWTAIALARWRRPAFWEIVLAPPVAGAVCGALAGAVLAGGAGFFYGLLVGDSCGLAFLPATLILATALRASARPDTPSGRAQRRAAWCATAGSIAIAAVIAKHHRVSVLPVELAAIAFVLAAIALVRDGSEMRSLWRLIRIMQRTLARRSTSRLEQMAPEMRMIDLGIGDAVFDEIALGAPFRGGELVVRSVRGEPFEALDAVANALVRDLLVLLFTGGIFVALAS